MRQTRRPSSATRSGGRRVEGEKLPPDLGTIELSGWRRVIPIRQPRSEAYAGRHAARCLAARGGGDHRNVTANNAEQTQRKGSYAQWPAGFLAPGCATVVF